MRPRRKGWNLAICAVSCVLIAAPAQAEESRNQIRSGFEALSHEMSTCAAYFSLLSSIVENADGPAEKVETAQRIKSIGQAMLKQSMNIANLIGMADNRVMERVEVALKDMVNTVNGDPPNSLVVMHMKYGQPCDDLLESGPRRFADLMARDGRSF